MRLAELLSCLNEPNLQVADVEVTGITYDSRRVKPGNVFVCIKGFSHDGHAYANEAARKGAVAIIAERSIPILGIPVVLVEDTRLALSKLAERYFDEPTSKVRLIGVTGTKGKTTTTFLIRSILQKAGMKTGLMGTVLNIVGDDVQPVSHTTPEAPELCAAIAKMAASGCTHAVMEVSSHAIALKRVAGSRFKGAVFTNLSQDHLDFHGNMESYFQVKASFLRGIATAAGPEYVAVNVDDPYGVRIAGELSEYAISYGIREPAMIRATDVEVSPKGTRFKIGFPGGRSERVKAKLIGMFNVYNLLAASSVSFREGVKIEDIVEAIELFDGVPGRFESIDEGQDFTVVVDYAHSPASLENVLLTARELGPERIITVFGCGGDRDRSKRPIMGEVVSRLSDYAIVTSDNPRSEEPEEIIKEILPGFRTSAYEVIPDRGEAIFRALNMAKSGDFVLIAGKGHETYQVLKDRAIHFDDREVARDVLRRLK
ncbi:MAG TPA: UDP-N-acetylmuramoyl-L-alanyl-D-glutamate--2,6-diaminopimelate ligase [Firmicutes bacterium]|nr:UDP-N-acetylmuramoyl-L-alanyl-D-glutamate--2,6-diaminopimelate ligase [Bacillota bacterium]